MFNQRARGRGYGRGHGSYRGSGTYKLRNDTDLPGPTTGQERLASITTINSDVPEASYKVINTELVASYNLTDNHKVPTILVPGKPPRWSPPAQQQTSLHEDGGIYYRDPNSSRHPTYPTEPAVAAVLHHHAQWTAPPVSLFGCGNTFGSLLSFSRDEERTFRFGVERVGSTTFLVRKTNTPGETIEDVRGYGHTFPEAYTTWEPEVKSAASYQRIIKYNFAGINCMIRSESDGYLPEKLLTGGNRNDEPIVKRADVQLDSSLNDFMSLSNLGIKAPPPEGPLELKEAGEPIPQEAIFDLKTRSFKVKEKLGSSIAEFLPRLWANQTPNFVLAFHKYGTFQRSEIRIKDVRPDVKAWETSNQETLSKLANVYHQLIELSKKHACLEVRRKGNGPLEIWTVPSGWSVLSIEMKKKWQAGPGAGYEVGGDDISYDQGIKVAVEPPSVKAEKEPEVEVEVEDEDEALLRF